MWNNESECQVVLDLDSGGGSEREERETSSHTDMSPSTDESTLGLTEGITVAKLGHHV